MARRGSEPATISNRRNVLKYGGSALGAITLSALAGCSNNSGGGTEQTSGSDGSNNGGGGGSDNNTIRETTNPAQIPRGGHLQVGLSEGLRTMSPYQGFLADYMAMEVMYDRLVRVSRDFTEIQPNLARDWESNEDATRWTFYLQEDATFSNMDGQSVLAEDVVATAEYLRSDGCAGCQQDISTVDSISVIDDHTIEITTTHPDTALPKRFTESGNAFNIAPKSILEDDPSQLENTDYGSGPFTLTEWDQQNQIVFEAKDDYHLEGQDGEPLPYLDQMTWDITPDNIARVNKLSEDQIDSVLVVPPTQVQRTRQQANVVEQATGEQFPIVLNTTIEPFQSVEVRQAIKHGMDRSAMLSAISNRGEIGLHSAMTPVQQYYNDDLGAGHMFGTEANPERAQELLAEAGYGDGVELPPLYTPGQRVRPTLAQAFQQQMESIGIEFEIQQITSETFLSDYWNTDDVWYISNWVTRVVDSSMPLISQHSEGDWNSTRWSNSEYDEALESAVRATNDEERASMLSTCQEINHTQGAWVQTIFTNFYSARKDRVQNYNPYPTSNGKAFLQYCAISES